MSDAPYDWNRLHNPLRVWVEMRPGENEYVIDHRTAPRTVLLGSNETMNRAELAVWAGPTEVPNEDALNVAAVMAGAQRPDWGKGLFVGPDQKIMIVLDRGRTTDDDDDDVPLHQVVFQGYVGDVRYEERSGPPQSSRGFTLIVQSMLERLSDQGHAWIAGRWMRTAEAQDALDATQDRDDATAHGDLDSVGFAPVWALPCAFNAGGEPNRAAAPITVSLGGESQLIHVFAPDGDPDAEPWTFAQILRHLAFFYQLRAYDDSVEITEQPGLVRDGNLFALTAALATQSIADRPDPPVTDATAWSFAVLDEPKSLSVEGMNVVEAFIAVAGAAGIRFREAIETVQQGEATTALSRLYWGARGAGTLRTLRRQATFADRELPAQVITRRTNAGQLTLEVDYRDIVTDPVILGDVLRHEVTVELVPGWMPDDNLDDVSDVDAARAYAEEHWDLDAEDIVADPWYQRYHPSGSLFHSGQNRLVGRRWILNTTGAYRAADYARSTGPYVAAAYAPWEPSDASITETSVDNAGQVVGLILKAGAWSRRPRPFWPCLSADQERRSLGVVVEFSFDAGATWTVIPGVTIVAVDDDSAIHLDAQDLTEVFPVGGYRDDEHLWFALLEDRLRVRVTAVIESDARVSSNLGWLRAGAAPRITAKRVFEARDRFASNRRDSANSQFGPAGVKAAASQTLDTREDTGRAQARAEALYELLSARQNACSAVVPWLELAEYAVMDSVLNIEGLGIRLASHGGGRVDRATDIVAIEYTEGMTRLILEDPRMVEQVET
jgi:hypothetical protein